MPTNKERKYVCHVLEPCAINKRAKAARLVVTADATKKYMALLILICRMSKILSKIDSIIVFQVSSQIMIHYHSKIAAQMLPRFKSLYDKQTKESSDMLRSKSLCRQAKVCISERIVSVCYFVLFHTNLLSSGSVQLL